MLFMKDYITSTNFFLRVLGAGLGERSLVEEMRSWLTTLLYVLLLSLHIVSAVRGSLGAEASEMVISLSAALYGASCTLKVLLLQLVWRRHYPELLDFADGWYLLDNSISRKFRLLYEGSLYTAFLLCMWFMLLPVLAWRRILPISPYDPPWDVHTSFLGYGVCFFVQLLTMVTIMAALVAGDYAILMCCIGFRNRLTNIRDSFEKLSTDSDISMLLLNIKHHQVIVRKLKVLEIPCAPLFFLQVFTTFIGSCFMLFSAIKQGVESIEVFMRLFICVMSVYSQLMLYCWVGQNITNASESLQFAIYNNKWYECSPKTRETFHMVETFTSKNFEIQSSFVVKMSLKTFHKVITESYTFLMVLMRMTNKGEAVIL